MPFDQNPEVIAKIVARIIANDSEIAAAMEESAYDLADMQSESEPLWEVVHDELRKYETVERELTERVQVFEAKNEPEPMAHDSGGGCLQTLFQGAASLSGAGMDLNR